MSKATPSNFRRCQRQVFWNWRDFKGRSFGLKQVWRWIPLGLSRFQRKSFGFEQISKASPSDLSRFEKEFLSTLKDFKDKAFGCEWIPMQFLSTLEDKGKSLAGWKRNSFRFKQNSKATCKFRRFQRQVFWICADVKGKTFRLEQLPKAVPLNQTD